MPKKDNIMDNYLVKLAQNNEHQAWAGLRMPFNMEPIDFTNSTNFRLSSSLHQQFKIVWLYEITVNDFNGLSWQIVLDESIRLLGEDGYIVIRMHNTDAISIPMVKAFLGRHIGINCDVEYETTPEQMEDVFVLSVHRKNIKQYSDKSWTFAILTMGNKVHQVCQFLKSIRSKDMDNEYEIIIVGPYNDAYEYYKVKYIDIDQFRDNKYAEVCKKKNAVIDKATKANLMIIHDRYFLGDNFFDGFDSYGYDFDFLTIKQFDLNGKEFPSYSATRRKMVFSGQIQVNNYSQLLESQYLNGGLIIFKTVIAKQIHFNSLLFWAQMEDVELAKVFMEHSIIPRINFLSSAITMTVKKGYMINWDIVDDKINNIQVIADQGESFKRLLIHYLVSRIPSSYKSTKIYQFLKMHIKH